MKWLNCATETKRSKENPKQFHLEPAEKAWSQLSMSLPLKGS